MYKTKQVNLKQVNPIKNRVKNMSKNIINELFTEAMLEKRLVFPITKVNQHFDAFLLATLKSKLENRCIEEGYVLASSIHIEQKSVGKVTTHGIEMYVVFSCKICRPVEGMMVHCTVTDITKAGIHADCYTPDGKEHPLTVYILRDHFYRHPLFEEGALKKNQQIHVKVVGVRYELNDPCIHVIAEFAEKVEKVDEDEDEDDGEEDEEEDDDED